MANFIEYADNLTAEIYVTNSSRYFNSPVIFYGNDKKITFTTYKKANTTATMDDKYMLITSGYEFRPDLVSDKVYGVPDFWWRIMQENNIYDIINFKKGITVRVPSIIF
jgi:hypothetical protein